MKFITASFLILDLLFLMSKDTPLSSRVALAMGAVIFGMAFIYS